MLIWIKMLTGFRLKTLAPQFPFPHLLYMVMTHAEGQQSGQPRCGGVRRPAAAKSSKEAWAGGGSWQQTARRSGSKHLGWAWRRQDRCSWVGRGGI